MLPGWQAIALAAAMQGGWPDIRLLALFFIGATLMRAAGCAFNDIVDKDFDAKVARTASRPLPSGQISVTGAWVFVALCCLISLAILLSLNGISIILGVASLALVVAYPFMKRITWWPQAWLGLTFNWGALLGFAAATGGHGLTTLVLPEHPLPALLLYASGVFWTLGYDTIYAVQDLEDDALAGVKSSARRLGSAAPGAVLGFYLACLSLVTAMAWAAGLGLLFAPLAGIYGLHLVRQSFVLNVNSPTGALALFKSNTVAGLVLFAAIFAGHWR